MRFFFVLFFAGLVSSVALILMPWWIPMVVAFLLVLLLPMSYRQSFMAPALGVGLAFLLIAFWKDWQNTRILSTRVAELFSLPSGLLLVLVSGLIGFVTAGLGGLSAAFLVSFSRSLLYSEPEGAEEPEVDEESVS